MIQLGAMPLPRFLALHPDAKVTAQELIVLKSYLSPWSNQTDAAEAKTSADAVGVPTPMVSLAEAPPEHNGLTMDPGIGDWKLISITDRGDNNTLRLILGNEVAMRAIQSGNILPWPDGAKIAKVAWQKQRGVDGMVVPGKFVQIELMAKDAQVYGATEGWGWGRWRGPTLQPYGVSATYVQECTGCHMPVKGNDNVYTLPISQAKVDRQEIVNNAAAALPGTLPYQPLGWTPITMSVDSVNESVAVLFGNAAAAKQIKNYSKGPPELQMAYPEGSVLALVTWHQRDDPHWFGARIPSNPEAVEFLIVGAKPAIGYKRFQGRLLSPASENAAVSNERTKLILGLVPAQYPH